MSDSLATIDDFHVGKHASFTKTFTEDDMQRFIDITGDVNPLHVDEDFAARSPFRMRILQGMLTASLFSTMVGMRLPGLGAIYRAQSIRFLKPVHLNETVTAHFESRRPRQIKVLMRRDFAAFRVLRGRLEIWRLAKSHARSPISRARFARTHDQKHDMLRISASMFHGEKHVTTVLKASRQDCCSRPKGRMD